MIFPPLERLKGLTPPLACRVNHTAVARDRPIEAKIPKSVCLSICENIDYHIVNSFKKFTNLTNLSLSEVVFVLIDHQWSTSNSRLTLSLKFRPNL